MKAELERMYVDKYDQYVNAMSYRAGGIPNAEDVVQEAFTRALKYSSTYDGERDINAWFGTIMNNALADFKQMERRQGAVDHQDESDQLDNQMFKEQMYETIIRHINSKRDTHRQALAMFLLAGYTAKEVAEVVDLTPNNVRQVVFQFKKEMIDSYGEVVLC